MSGAEGNRLVKSFKDSKLSQREYCKKYSIKRITLRYWLDRVEDYRIGNEVRFCELVVRSRPSISDFDADDKFMTGGEGK